METCRSCNRPRPRGYSVTCGNSYCQEAGYWHNRLTNSRGKRVKREAHANFLRASGLADSLAYRLQARTGA